MYVEKWSDIGWWDTPFSLNYCCHLFFFFLCFETKTTGDCYNFRLTEVCWSDTFSPFFCSRMWQTSKISCTRNLLWRRLKNSNKYHPPESHEIYNSCWWPFHCFIINFIAEYSNMMIIYICIYTYIINYIYIYICKIQQRSIKNEHLR